MSHNFGPLVSLTFIHRKRDCDAARHGVNAKTKELRRSSSLSATDAEVRQQGHYPAVAMHSVRRERAGVEIRAQTH